MSLSQFFQHLINGITLGGIYALIALGYTMVYGILGFINFAHGDILMVGAYAGLFIFTALRGGAGFGAWTLCSFFIAMALSMAISAALGMTIEKVAYKPLRKATRLAPLLSAIGVSFILENLAAWMWGTQAKPFPKPFEDNTIFLGGVTVTPHQIMTLVVTIIMMIGMQAYVTRTRMGKAMRATSMDQDTAQLMGINSDKVISLTFGIGSALAGCGGILIALDFTCYPTLGMITGLKAFVAAVIGGIGNIPGAMLGGIVLGLLETFGVAILHIPTGLKDTIAFVTLIIVLLVKPEGLLGHAEKEKV